MSPEQASARRLAMERRLVCLPLSFNGARDPAVELARFPSLVELYWRLVGETHLPPLQASFVEAVAEDPSLAHLPRAAVRGRAGRAYPSLVRQHHFEYLLAEHFGWVFRGHLLDLAGIDFLLLHDGRAYGLGLSTATATAREWHGVKERRHDLPPIPTLDLWAEPERCVIGRFWLHGPEDIRQVLAFIERERARPFEPLRRALDDVYRAAGWQPR